MFDDPKKELEALEKQLLADEDWFQKELDSAKRMIDPDSKKSQRTTAARSAQAAKAPAKKGAEKKEAAKNAPAPKKKGVKKLLILLLVEILGILALAAYWWLFLL